MTDEDIRLRMLDWRGIEEGQECSRCGGAGTLAYSSTATWRGGAGGSTITTDVCATCWGSGTKRPWPNWRRIAADAETIKAREAAYDTAQEGLKSARKQESEMRETIRDLREKLRAQAERLEGDARFVASELVAENRAKDEEIERQVRVLRDALDDIKAKADFCIPPYAYGDNETACDMAHRLTQILRIAEASTEPKG